MTRIDELERNIYSFAEKLQSEPRRSADTHELIILLIMMERLSEEVRSIQDAHGMNR